MGVGLVRRRGIGQEPQTALLFQFVDQTLANASQRVGRLGDEYCKRGFAGRRSALGRRRSRRGFVDRAECLEDGIDKRSQLLLKAPSARLQWLAEIIVILCVVKGESARPPNFGR